MFVLLCLVIWGCISPDPEPDLASKTAGSRNAGLRTTRTFPTEILERRAFGESPILSTRVAAGDLPPATERLPTSPLVVHPIDRIGNYGGTLRRALTGDIAQLPGVLKTLAENLLAYSKPMPDSLVLGLASEYVLSDSGRTATFKLREGLRWSDGHPFTVDDIIFYYDDLLMDPEARGGASTPAGWTVDGKPIRFEKVDSLTLRVSATKPMGRLLHQLARPLTAAPKHVYARFHPRHNPEATYRILRDSASVVMRTLGPGSPTMSAWMPVEWERGQRVVYERNPYYWKIDNAGNQLPYADRLVFTVIQDTQIILLKFINGELDLFGRYTRADMYPVLRKEEAKGKFLLRVTGPNRGPTYHLNWDAPDERLRKAFRDKRVRMALSHSINREEINQLVFHGLLEPSGYSFGPLSPFFDRDDYQKYAWYDIPLANRLLDEAGYPDRDGDGYREFADGSRFGFTIDYVHPGGALNGAPVSELVMDHWKDVGIEVHLNGALRDIIIPRRISGEFDVHYWGLEGPNDPLTYPIGWGIFGRRGPYWHQKAVTDGPDWLWEATESLKKAQITTDPVELRHHMTRVRRLHTENIPLIAIGSLYSVWGANTRLGNVPEQNVADNAFLGWSGLIFHEQIYIRPAPNY